MLGRQFAVALRRPLQARLHTHTPTTLCIRTFTQAPELLAGRPKKAVGEPSKPVKRAPKSTTTTKAKASDAAAKKKLAEKKKLAAKKAADAKKKKAKRELSPEEVEKRKARLQKAEVKELKKAVLPIPAESKRKTTNAYAEFMREQADRFKSGMADKSSPADKQAALSEISRDIASEWNNLSSSQHAHYAQLANASKEKSAAAYKRWVESHTVEEISIANTARRALNRLHAAGKIRSKYPLISDERSVKRPMSAWNQYFTSRMGSSDFSNVANRERAGQVSQEWKALDEGEKKKFYDLASKDTERYVSEYTAVYGRAPKSVSPQPSA